MQPQGHCVSAGGAPAERHSRTTVELAQDTLVSTQEMTSGRANRQFANDTSTSAISLMRRAIPTA